MARRVFLWTSAGSVGFRRRALQGYGRAQTARIVPSVRQSHLAQDQKEDGSGKARDPLTARSKAAAAEATKSARGVLSGGTGIFWRPVSRVERPVRRFPGVRLEPERPAGRLLGAVCFPLRTAGFPAGAAGFPFGAADFPAGAASFPLRPASFPTGAAGFPLGVAGFPEVVKVLPPGSKDFLPGLKDLPQASTELVETAAVRPPDSQDVPKDPPDGVSRPHLSSDLSQSLPPVPGATPTGHSALTGARNHLVRGYRLGLVLLRHS